MSLRIATLLSWCETNGVEIDRRIFLKESPHSGLTVFAADALTPSHISLVRIPKSAVLSVKSSPLAQYIDAPPYGHGAHLALALALYAEILSSSNSRWYGYIQSLPEATVDVASLWGRELEWCARDCNGINAPDIHDSRCHDAMHDVREALNWMTGTGLEHELQVPASEEEAEEETTGRSILESVRCFYFDVVEPLLYRLPESTYRLPPELHLENFYHAYSLVSSRAFLVDAYHGLAMVPIADAFDHAQDNQVHLESDYDVCVVCGSLEECAHDREDVGPGHHTDTSHDYRSSSSSTPTSTPSSAGYYEMVSNAAILPHTEVFNTYGAGLTNAQLLAQYGFVLAEGNAHDGVGWRVGDLQTFAVSEARRPAAAAAPPVEWTLPVRGAGVGGGGGGSGGGGGEGSYFGTGDDRGRRYHSGPTGFLADAAVASRGHGHVDRVMALWRDLRSVGPGLGQGEYDDGYVEYGCGGDGGGGQPQPMRRQRQFWARSELVYDPGHQGEVDGLEAEVGDIADDGHHHHACLKRKQARVSAEEGEEGREEAGEEAKQDNVGRRCRAVVLRVNGDAQVTSQLWLLCALLHLDVDAVMMAFGDNDGYCDSYYEDGDDDDDYYDCDYDGQGYWKALVAARRGGGGGEEAGEAVTDRADDKGKEVALPEGTGADDDEAKIDTGARRTRVELWRVSQFLRAVANLQMELEGRDSEDDSNNEGYGCDCRGKFKSGTTTPEDCHGRGFGHGHGQGQQQQQRPHQQDQTLGTHHSLDPIPGAGRDPGSSAVRAGMPDWAGPCAAGGEAAAVAVAAVEQQRRRQQQRRYGRLVRAHLLCTAHTVLALCRARGERMLEHAKERVGLAQSGVVTTTMRRTVVVGTLEALGEYLDGLPAHMIKTKMVIGEVLSELSILESCCSRWEELVILIGTMTHGVPWK